MNITKHKALAAMLLLHLFIISNTAVAQTVTLDTEKEFCTYITPSPSNLMLLLFATPTQFQELMVKYQYRYSAENDMYIAPTNIKDHFRTVKKRVGYVDMTFSPNNGYLVNNFYEELKQIVEGITATYEDGWVVYRLTVPYNEVDYNVTFRLTDDTDISAIQVFITE